MEKLFKLKELNTTPGVEIRAGITTFLAMAYIIFVNPVFLSVTGMDSTGAMIATCLATAIGCTLCAFISNKPFALSTGMGMNAFFAYTLCGGYGYTWQQALALVFLSGVCYFVVILVFKDTVVNLIPKNLKHAFTVGIGMFLALIGFLDCGLIDMSSGLPGLGDLKNPAVLIAVFGVFLTMALVAMDVTGGLMIGMLATAVVSIVCGQTALPDHLVTMPGAISNVAFKLSFSGLLQNGKEMSSVVSLAALLITMTIIDMFDSVGYLIGTGTKAGMLQEDGSMPGMKRMMMTDATSTMLGSLTGTSTVTVFAESSSGIAAGGKSGLTAITVAILFLISMFLSPVASVMSASVTSPALIIVGIYLLMDVKNLELDNVADAIPVLLTVIAIPLTYSITAGMGIGYLSYVVCSVCTRKKENITPGVLVLAVIFLAYFVMQ